MTPIAFRANPAFVTLSEAIELAVAHLRSNLVLWGVPTLIYALVAGALTYAFTAQMGDWVTPYVRDPAAAERMAQRILDNLPGIVGFVLLLALGGLALYCVAMALAVGGLPGRRMTIDSAISAALWTIVVGVLYVVAVVLPIVALGVVAAAAGSQGAIVLLLVGIPTLMVAWTYLALRLVFALYAIFDGVGVVDSLRVSWAITQGGILRTLGWLAALVGISFAISIASGIAGAPFATLPAVSTVIGSLLTTAYTFFQATTLAILYESQRLRHVMTTPGVPALPGGPVAARPARETDPLQPPPPPAW
jgi:hypothetical protein